MNVLQNINKLLTFATLLTTIKCMHYETLKYVDKLILKFITAITNSHMDKHNEQEKTDFSLTILKFYTCYKKICVSPTPIK